MESEEEHRQNVKPRNERTQKSEDHHRVNVVMPKWIHCQSGKARVGRAQGKMEQVKDNEGEQDNAAHDHRARSESRFYNFLAPIARRTGAPIFDGKPDRVIDMHQDGEEKKRSNDPKQRTKSAQVLGVAINPVRPEKNLQVAEEMADDKKDENHPAHCHNQLPSDG